MGRSGFVKQFIRKPQQMRARWWIFQIHLWAGIALALYMVVVGVSGSILVFREELTALQFPGLMNAPAATAPLADISTVVAQVKAKYPQHRISGVRLPALYTQNFKVFLATEDGLTVFADPVDGHVIGEMRREGWWITWIQQLHFYLLAGKTGLLVNGAGGLLLVMLCFTGIIIWWPGIRRWTRSLWIDFRSGWKRINWDLHGAVGFWTLPLVFAWGLTGAYFAWPMEFALTVNALSPVTNAVPKRPVIEPPTPAPPPGYAERLDFAPLVAKAQALNPSTDFAGIDFPANPKAPLTLLMARGERWNTRATNYVYFDPYRGTHKGTWQRGVNRTVGDAIVFLMGPLHFGVYWGMTVKILWAVLGFALSILAVTGILMYWNRSLGKQWRKWRINPTARLEVSSLAGRKRQTLKSSNPVSAPKGLSTLDKG